MDIQIIRSETRGGICPDCGYHMQPGEVNTHMEQHVALQMASRSQVYVPVTTMGNLILDNGRDVIAQCFTPELAIRIAELLNKDAFG
jgi:hypothetical protein